MSDLLFILMLGLTIYALVKLLLQPNRILEFPWFMSAAFISFILPQASHLYFNDSIIPPDWLEAVLLMIVLCWICCFVGYNLNAEKIKPSRMALAVLDEKRLREAGIAMVLFGIFFSIKVYKLAP